MMTVEQAGEVWCPMVRIARDESVTVRTAISTNLDSVKEERFIVGGCNTDALGGLRVPASCRCIADKCAMWRWADGDITYPRHLGFCGIAGRPEFA